MGGEQLAKHLYPTQMARRIKTTATKGKVRGKTVRIADLFCGAGGTSTGAVRAAEGRGYRVELTAVNHWEVAIATHAANHPGARHLQTAVDNVRPLALYRPGELDILWASPECTHFSRARSGKPKNDQSRATAWCVIRWAQELQPGVILVENVPDFLSWGGLGRDGNPLKAQRGKTFMAWVAALESLGYRVEWRILCAADYGDPTTRERLFVQAVRGRRKVVWPEPTHAKHPEGDLFRERKPWRAAREIIDWSLEGKSIFGRAKPLSAKTLSRIWTGLRKFGGLSIVDCYDGSGTRGDRVQSLDKPLGVVTGSNRFALSKAFLVQVAHGNGRGRNEDNRRVKSVESPLGAVTGSNEFGLAEAFIVPQFGEREGQTPRVHSVECPLPAVTSHGAGALVRPYLVAIRGSDRGQLENSAKDLDLPLGAVTAGGKHHALIQPFLVPTAHRGDERCASVDAPLGTVCGNRGDMALCEAALLPQQQGGRLRPVSEPVPTVAGAGAIGLVQPVLVIQDKQYVLDIRWRMLQPHELAGAQGFPRAYKFTGNKTNQVKQIGNAVPCGLAEALVDAVLEEGGRGR